MNARPAMKQKPLPKWFKGDIYNEGGVVANKFTGEEAELSPEELSMYDFIQGAEYVLARGGIDNKYREKLINEFQRGLDWFRRSNPSAYMVLLD